MMTKQEAGKSQPAMPGETNRTPRSLLKYAAFLLLLISAAWVSVPDEDTEGGDVSPLTARAAEMRDSHVSAVVEEVSGRDVGVYPDPYYWYREPHDDGGYFYYGCNSAGFVHYAGCH